MCNKNFQEEELAKLHPDGFFFNKVHIAGTLVSIAADDAFTAYPWENDILIKRTPERIQDVGEVYAQVDKIRIAAKGDAAEYLVWLVFDGNILL